MHKRKVPTESTLLAEHKAAISSFNHYDSFRWQAGSLLIAGSLVLLGILFSASGMTEITLVSSSIFITVLLSLWILFANHYRQLYMVKAARFHEIELQLGMKLNTRLGIYGYPIDKTKSKPELSIFGPKGHDIDMWIYIVISFFGPWMIYKLHEGFELRYVPLIVSGLLVFITRQIVNYDETRMKLSILRLLKLDKNIKHNELSARQVWSISVRTLGKILLYVLLLSLVIPLMEAVLIAIAIQLITVATDRLVQAKARGRV